AWEHIGVPEQPLPVSRMVQGSAVALLFLAMLCFMAFRPVRSRVLQRGPLAAKSARQGPLPQRSHRNGGAPSNAGAPSDGGAPVGGVGADGPAQDITAKDNEDQQSASSEDVASRAQAPNTPAAHQFQAWVE